MQAERFERLRRLQSAITFVNETITEDNFQQETIFNRQFSTMELFKEDNCMRQSWTGENFQQIIFNRRQFSTKKLLKETITGDNIQHPLTLQKCSKGS